MLRYSKIPVWVITPRLLTLVSGHQGTIRIRPKRLDSLNKQCSMAVTGVRNKNLIHKKTSLIFLHVFKSQYFFLFFIIIVLIYQICETSRNKLKKHSVTKNCSDLSLFEQIVLVVSKMLQILGLQPRISKVCFFSLEHFFSQ